MRMFCQKQLAILIFINICVCELRDNTIEDVITCWNGRPMDRCCKTMRRDTLPNLKLEYMCSDPENAIIQPPDQTASSFYRLFHYSLPKCLTRLPSNICDYPNIASIRLLYGNIQLIPRLSCLKKLIALDLDGNKIETVKRVSFAGLWNLRILDLRSNQIDYIDPYTFNELPGLMRVILIYNRLKTVEALWFLSIKHLFCWFDLRHNEIEQFSNEENWTFNAYKKYGPGYVSLSHNKFKKWWTSQIGIYGVTELTSLGALVSWGFDFRDNPWICDCKMHQYRLTFSNYHSAIVWRDYMNVTCASPAHLKGKPILDIPLDQFVCNITEKCPEECLCQNQSDNGYLLVDCRHGNLTSLPADLPEGRLKLVLAHNRILRLVSRNYLGRTNSIDVSSNDLEYIEPEAILILQAHVNMINMTHNKLSYLPEEIQNIPFSSLSLEDNPLVCDCNSTWMYTWLSQQGEDASGVTCTDPEGRKIPEEHITAESLKCQKVSALPTVFSIILGGLFFLFLVVLILLIVFRYEVMILLQTKLQGRFPPADYTHGLFVSLDEDGEVERGWVVRTLLPELEGRRGLKLYLPLRDMLPGSVTAEEVIKELKRSRTVLVMLSEGYVRNSSKLCEFQQAYNIMMSKRWGSVIVVRTAKVETNGNNILKGFIRLKKFLQIDDANIFDKIMKEMEIKHHE